EYSDRGESARTADRPQLQAMLARVAEDADVDAVVVHKVDRLARKTSPFLDVPRPDAADAHWVAPELVGEVTYSEWTGTGRLRHPVWRGWRLDKDPAEVVREG
ncbi:MAG: recombinase family protein, partial [Actinomycetes bacterium]